ncbi:hypothetical protein [Schlesneria paludicola]|uniref:hypothetical protein n=1 Tax=Schlesneria paludicola TaxID=360056 RepID=UPI0012FB65B1|nr:hypothetical protein [Schlesneria paludicola]
MRFRTWSLIFRTLPEPFRSVGLEFLRTVEWIDSGVRRFLIQQRQSPAWLFVTLVGTVSIALTVLLFASLTDPNVGGFKKSTVSTAARSGRDELRRSHDWSAQDRWRVVHFFVPNQPAPHPKNIQLDTRLFAEESGPRRGIEQRSRPIRDVVAQRNRASRDFDVRLDLGRPKQAQQEIRLAAGTTLGLGSKLSDRPMTRIRSRDPRLLVHAAWEFSAECDRYAHLGRPYYRPLPPSLPDVPVEEPVAPPIKPVRLLAPELTIDVQRYRWISTAGLFPPGSHLVSRSELSVMPFDESRFQSELVSYGQSDWQRAQQRPSQESDEVVPYAGIGLYNPLRNKLHTSDEYDQSIPSAADVALRLELIAPTMVGLGQPQNSSLRVGNRGTDSIPRIEIEDFVTRGQTIVGADPDAEMSTLTDPATNATYDFLHRELHRLRPGERQELVLKWLANETRHQPRRTRIIAHAAVSAATTVSRPPEPDQPMTSVPPEAAPEKHPSLACDVQYLERVRVGDEVELEITVRNTGDTALHDVRVRMELPSQLSHRDGKNFLINAGNLPIQGRYQSVLRVAAVEVGDAVNQLQVAAAERIEARGETKITVLERAKEPAPAAIPPVPATTPAPVKAKPVPAAPKPIPTPSVPVNNCCCQQLSMLDIVPEFWSP